MPEAIASLTAMRSAADSRALRPDLLPSERARSSPTQRLDGESGGNALGYQGLWRCQIALAWSMAMSTSELDRYRFGIDAGWCRLSNDENIGAAMKMLELVLPCRLDALGLLNDALCRLGEAAVRRVSVVCCSDPRLQRNPPGFPTMSPGCTDLKSPLVPRRSRPPFRDDVARGGGVLG
jgi:hypothetical protein